MVTNKTAENKDTAQKPENNETGGFRAKVSYYKRVNGREEKITKEFSDEKEYNEFIRKHPDLDVELSFKHFANAIDNYMGNVFGWFLWGNRQPFLSHMSPVHDTMRGHLRNMKESMRGLPSLWDIFEDFTKPSQEVEWVDIWKYEQKKRDIERKKAEEEAMIQEREARVKRVDDTIKDLEERKKYFEKEWDKEIVEDIDNDIKTLVNKKKEIHSEYMTKKKD